MRFEEILWLLKTSGDFLRFHLAYRYNSTIDFERCKETAYICFNSCDRIIIPPTKQLRIYLIIKKLSIDERKIYSAICNQLSNNK